ncbi:MAG: carbohydrate binding domain-containing protein [Armatimonadia bacterium]
MSCFRFLTVLLVLAVVAPVLAQPMVYEAEAVVATPDAWNKDKGTTDKWNVWSTDSDAMKKWSGGVVLQSPPVMKDRETPEEGAPSLHIVIPNLTAEAYVVEMKGGRDLAVSLDGKEWKRLSDLGWRLGNVPTKDGKVEFWVDDRFADKVNPGFGYLDTITITPKMPDVMGVVNGGFEVGKDFATSGWAFYTREPNMGTAELVSPGHAGQKCVKIEHTGEKDFALTNSGRLDVKPGEAYKATAWMNCEATEGADLSIVAMGGGKLLTWSLAADGVWATKDWQKLEASATVPEGCDQLYLRVTGGGKAKVWVDEVAFEPTTIAPVVAKPKTKVTGWAKTRVQEKLSRGIVAMPLEGKKVYVGWRLLNTDPKDIGFNLYRGTGRAIPVKLNDKPLTQTTDFVDEKAPLEMDNRWWVKPVVGGKELAASETASLPANPEVKGYYGFKLQGDYQFQKVGLGDLNGDGQMDYVIKQPIDNIDPYSFYWYKSPDTYKLEAYLHDGTHLWTYDLGWPIERGIWYSPYVVYDFDGDGKAEVAVKTGEGDPRDEDGRVTSGPEYCSIIDGMTGKEKTRVAWPTRKLMGGGGSGYNYASRNQMGIAFLDGKTPALLVARGTYTVMVLTAYQYQKGKLQELWTWDNREEKEGNWRGQGAHWMHSGDVDADGRDEVILGSCVVDDNGKGLWTTGLGHPDRCFLGDLDPERPGLEIFYNIEPRQKTNGVLLVDAKTGEIIWGLQEQTYHVGSGMAADIDPRYPGQECWAGESEKGDPAGKDYGGNTPKWLLSVKGEILARDNQVPTWTTVYWDADAQKELAGGARIFKYKGQNVAQGVEGAQSFWADIIGDWREELVTSVKGELRVYTTTIPATERRVCLLQDPIYRADVAHLAMGYAQNPTLGYYIAQVGPAMWMSGEANALQFGKTLQMKVTLSAPADAPAGGTVRLTADGPLTVTPDTVQLQAGKGQMAEAAVQVTLKEKPALLYGGKVYSVLAKFEGTPAAALQASAAVKVEEEPLAGVPLAQAEDVAAEEGGKIQVRDDKLGAVGKAISHWDTQGHALSWKINVPQEGKYWLIVRCCSPTGVKREVTIDGGPALTCNLGGTGGFSSLTSSEWAHQAVRGADGNRFVYQIAAGEHMIKMVNVDGKGLNLDYVALVPVK